MRKKPAGNKNFPGKNTGSMMKQLNRLRDHIFLIRLLDKVERKIKSKPGWRSLRKGDKDYDFESYLRIEKFLKHLTEEEAAQGKAKPK